MLVKRYTTSGLWGILIVILSIGLMPACNESEPTAPEGIRTWLLVKAPEVPLQSGKSVKVRSRSEDVGHGISHVELYAVQMPTGESNVLIRSDAAPFPQTTFTAVQTFTPIQPGHYVIKVVGYNNIGQNAESEYISFEVK